MLMASCWVSRLMLYGHFIFVKMPMTSGEANAIPNRMAAHPHAFEKVCRIIRLGYSSRIPVNDGWSEKSAYASSTMTMPWNSLSKVMISLESRLFPVGLLGEQRNISLVV